MVNLTEIPNIGNELSSSLYHIGITNYPELLALGSRKAFQLLYAKDPDVCINTLYALEGAVQHTRWYKLDAGTKDELKQFFNLLKRSEI